MDVFIGQEYYLNIQGPLFILRLMYGRKTAHDFHLTQQTEFPDILCVPETKLIKYTPDNLINSPLSPLLLSKVSFSK